MKKFLLFIIMFLFSFAIFGCAQSMHYTQANEIVKEIKANNSSYLKNWMIFYIYEKGEEGKPNPYAKNSGIEIDRKKLSNEEINIIVGLIIDATKANPKLAREEKKETKTSNQNINNNIKLQDPAPSPGVDPAPAPAPEVQKITNVKYLIYAGENYRDIKDNKKQRNKEFHANISAIAKALDKQLTKEKALIKKSSVFYCICEEFLNKIEIKLDFKGGILTDVKGAQFTYLNIEIDKGLSIPEIKIPVYNIDGTEKAFQGWAEINDKGEIGKAISHDQLLAKKFDKSTNLIAIWK